MSHSQYVVSYNNATLVIAIQNGEVTMMKVSGAFEEMLETPSERLRHDVRKLLKSIQQYESLDTYNKVLEKISIKNPQLYALIVE